MVDPDFSAIEADIAAVEDKQQVVGAKPNRNRILEFPTGTFAKNRKALVRQRALTRVSV